MTIRCGDWDGNGKQCPESATKAYRLGEPVNMTVFRCGGHTLEENLAGKGVSVQEIPFPSLTSIEPR